MLKKIESLREKPKHIRNAYAFWCALAVTLIIALFWSTTLPATLSNTKATSTAEQIKSTEQESSFFHTLGEIKASLIGMFTNLRTNTEYVQETKPEEAIDPNILDLKKIYEGSLKNAKTSSSTNVSASTTRAR